MLTDRHAPNDELILTGPQALNYAEVTSIITEVIGREVRQVRLRVPEVRRRYLDIGMPEPFASALAAVDADIERGSEDLVTPIVRQATGREPRSLRDFVRAHRAEWAAA